MDFSKYMNQPKTAAGNPAPPIPPAVEKNLPYFSYFSQVVQPLVFDNSLSFYEVCTRLAAAVNNNILQINQLTGAMKEFMEYMVKWGTELNAEWEEYKTDLTGKWEAYQNDLNRQWNEYKTTLTAEWVTYQTNLTNEWNTFRDDYREEWEQFKNSINSTIEKNVGDWLTANGETIINNWLETKVPGWISVSNTLDPIDWPSRIDLQATSYTSIAYNPFLKMYQFSTAVTTADITEGVTNSSHTLQIKVPSLKYSRSIILWPTNSIIYYNDASKIVLYNFSQVRLERYTPENCLKIQYTHPESQGVKMFSYFAFIATFYSNLPPE